jgi:virginiamycin B lyase
MLRRIWLVASIVTLAAVGFIGRPAVSASPLPRPNVQVTFTEWQTPSQPPFPHDPAYNSADGSVWYTGQRANVIGRLDPQTGTFKEFPLPTPNSGPHGLTIDTDGSVWYTGNSAALIGKLNPKTGAVQEYKMPDPRATDPHTPIFGADGKLYFTVQNSNFIGRLDPNTGAITLAQPPTAHAVPYGIARASTGRFYFDEFNSNRIGELEPNSMAITEHVLPNADTRPRRIAIARDDTVYYSDYARGYLGHLDPKTDHVVEFASPGGAASRPYAIAVTADGVVWYCETGITDKNTLVRFDPATKQMQSWPIPSGGSTVRNMVVGRDQELWLAESGVGKIARAMIK